MIVTIWWSLGSCFLLSNLIEATDIAKMIQTGRSIGQARLVFAIVSTSILMEFCFYFYFHFWRIFCLAIRCLDIWFIAYTMCAWNNSHENVWLNPCSIIRFKCAHLRCFFTQCYAVFYFFISYILFFLLLFIHLSRGMQSMKSYS